MEKDPVNCRYSASAQFKAEALYSTLLHIHIPELPFLTLRYTQGP